MSDILTILSLTLSFAVIAWSVFSIARMRYRGLEQRIVHLETMMDLNAKHLTALNKVDAAQSEAFQAIREGITARDEYQAALDRLAKAQDDQMLALKEKVLVFAELTAAHNKHLEAHDRMLEIQLAPAKVD